MTGRANVYTPDHARERMRGFVDMASDDELARMLSQYIYTGAVAVSDGTSGATGHVYKGGRSARQEKGKR